MKKTMPILFIGHGSPMNVLAVNSYTAMLQGLASRFPRPEAILAVSAHWLTEGTRVTGSVAPEQIYDFYGFPDELYAVAYKAPGSPSLAKKICEMTAGEIENDGKRGIDHAGWAVLHHLYPLTPVSNSGDTPIPVLELSIAIRRGGEYQTDLGKKLSPLRDEGILIIGSGNIVHNLGIIQWKTDAEPYPWAVRFDETVKGALDRNDVDKLVSWQKLGDDARFSVPTPDHYLPLLTILGAKRDGERPVHLHEGIQNGSVSMRAVGFGL